MKLKNLIFVSVLIFITTIFLASFVAAQSLRESLDKLSEEINPVIGWLLGDVSGGGEILVVKLLVFLLLLIIVTVAVGKIPGIGDKPTLSFLIAVIVSILAIRFVASEQLVNFIWLPYGVIGVVFLSLFSFLLGFFFIESFESSMIRKTGWTAYLVIFIGLAYTRWDKLSVGAKWYENLALVYLAIAVISLILIIYDRQIRRWKFKSKLKDVQDRKARVEAARVQEDIDELTRRLGAARDEETRRALREEIKEKKNTLSQLLGS